MDKSDLKWGFGHGVFRAVPIYTLTISKLSLYQELLANLLLGRPQHFLGSFLQHKGHRLPRGPFQALLWHFLAGTPMKHPHSDTSSSCVSPIAAPIKSLLHRNIQESPFIFHRSGGTQPTCGHEAGSEIPELPARPLGSHAALWGDFLGNREWLQTNTGKKWRRHLKL